MRIVNVVLGGSLLLVPAAGQASDSTPSYTNEDLDRIAARRGETGATSVPAFATATRETKREPGIAHGEAYWRQEADRLHERLQPLRRRAEALRFRIEHPSRPKPTHPSSKAGANRSQRPASDPLPALREQLRELEQEIRDREEHLEDRARREGALPGWLR